MSIVYSILGFIALGLFSVIVLPIVAVSFFVGVAGLVAGVGRWKTRTELEPKFSSLRVAEES
jgi:Na+/H+-dicarboxylate symporter